MSILLVGPANSMHVTRWLNFHSQKEIKFSISLSEYRKEIEIKERYHFKGGNIALPFNALRLMYFVLNKEIEVMHVHSIAKYGFFSLAACLFTDVKIILSAWGSDVAEGKNKFLNRLMIKYLLNRAEIIHVDANHMREKCIEISKKVKDKIKIIQYGTDLEKFKNKEQKIDSLFTILSIRNHEKIYNIDKIIDIFDNIFQDNPKIKLEVLGGGPNTQTLKSQADKLSSSSNISFSGFITQEEMIEKINASNLVISASDRDGGISVSIAEAMACEKVVIASNGPNDENDEWIEHGKTGFLFGLESFSDLELITRDCINNKYPLKEIGISARETIKRNYNFVNEMNKFDEIYKSLRKK